MIAAKEESIMKVSLNLYACGLCNESFSNTASLVEHVQIRHSFENKNETSAKIQKSSHVTMPEKNKICTNEIKNEEITSNESLMLDSIDFENTPQKQTFICKICQKCFKTKIYLNKATTSKLNQQ